MNIKGDSTIIFLMLLFCLLPSTQAASQCLAAVVDLERILHESNAAHLGREHFKDVKATLDNGYQEMSRELAKVPEKKRNKDLLEASRALNRQLEIERAAINQVIMRMALEEIRSYRINNKLDLILPRHLILDADSGLDITSQIIKAMNTKKPTFGKLPVVQVKKQATPPPSPPRASTQKRKK